MEARFATADPDTFGADARRLAAVYGTAAEAFGKREGLESLEGIARVRPFGGLLERERAKSQLTLFEIAA